MLTHDSQRFFATYHSLVPSDEEFDVLCLDGRPLAVFGEGLEVTPGLLQMLKGDRPQGRDHALVEGHAELVTFSLGELTRAKVKGRLQSLKTISKI